MCGGTREALAIRRTLSDRQCSRACEIVLSVWSYQSINPLPPDQAPSPQTPPPKPLPQLGPFNGVCIKNSILATISLQPARVCSTTASLEGHFAAPLSRLLKNSLSRRQFRCSPLAFAQKQHPRAQRNPKKDPQRQN